MLIQLLRLLLESTLSLWVAPLLGKSYNYLNSRDFLTSYFGVGVICNSYHSSTEVAAYLANKAASVSIICRNEVPLEKTLGPKVGGYVKALHESKGVQFVINAEVTAFTSKSGEGSFINYVETIFTFFDHLLSTSTETFLNLSGQK